MKKNKVIIAIISIIGLVTLVFSGVISYKIFNDQSIDYITRYSVIGNISQIAAMAIAGINLFAILYFFYFDKRDKIEDNKILSKAQWFSDFVYEKNIIKIEEFFIKLNEIVINANSIPKDMSTEVFSDLIKKEFENITEETFNISNILIPILDIIDKNLAEDLDNTILSLQDEITEELQKCACSDTSDKCKEIILKYRKKVIKILYDYNISIYNR
ncbi:TPA: hypothetical protein ACSQIM_000523 [Clostridium perfringens]|uniref:hypothetical protein n=2 Tax=Clostridium perfringens TaxID=1502 RepID=UPI0018987DBA|nr:hypothetical protein [Clostridium perfringens]EHK2307032.1 hypothetical protein [Clostridium perfringens]EJT6473932.1 hypothetical protein [Clostridium perfringens]EJT6479459.1 hypothetical protein [Clostridium perfringens]EJT6530716.1 hypothetical protein [Clostridium perfringens]MDK0607062.1 hypothetical protein [Clostridium perfringens]